MTQNAIMGPTTDEAQADTAAASAPRRVVVEPKPPSSGSRLRDWALPFRLLCVRILNYLTNNVVAYVPSFTIRHLWYRRVLGFQIGQGAGVHLHAYVWSYGPRQISRDGARIGRNSQIYHDCTIDVRSGLTIGDNVSISPEVMILGGTHDVNASRFSDVAGLVAIEDHAWIGTRSIILPGVTVGHGAVVAAGSVVTKNVAPLTIVAGVPAKPVGMRDSGATVYELDGPPPLFE